MEQKGFLLSALGVGVGVGVGLGLASGQAVNKWAGNVPSNAITLERMEQEMLRLIVDGRDSKVTFDDFPYFLRSHMLFHRFSVFLKKKKKKLDFFSRNDYNIEDILLNSVLFVFRVIESRVVCFRELQRIKFLIVNFPGIYIVVVLL